MVGTLDKKSEVTKGQVQSLSSRASYNNRSAPCEREPFGGASAVHGNLEPPRAAEQRTRRSMRGIGVGAENVTHVVRSGHDLYRRGRGESIE